MSTSGAPGQCADCSAVPESERALYQGAFILTKASPA
jgi:hypothetical protein